MTVYDGICQVGRIPDAEPGFSAGEHGAGDDGKVQQAVRSGVGVAAVVQRDAVRLARLRGVEVLLLDEGGLDQCEPELRERLLADVANAIDGIAAGKVTVRSPQGEPWMLTVVALNPGSAVPDLWLKLP
jgi:hypothetical protein